MAWVNREWKDGKPFVEIVAGDEATNIVHIFNIPVRIAGRVSAALAAFLCQHSLEKLLEPEDVRSDTSSHSGSEPALAASAGHPGPPAVVVIRDVHRYGGL